MALTKEQLQERAQLIRIYEASCSIEHPNEDELLFRRSVMLKLGVEYGLRGMRQWTIEDPGKLPRPQMRAETKSRE